MSALTAVSGVNYTKYAAGGMSNFVTQQWANNLQMVHDEYTVPAGDTVAVSTYINMGRVPKGARVLFFIFTNSGSGAASTGGIRIGEVAATAVAALTDMTSATTQVLGSLIAFSGTPLAAESKVDILLTSDADLDAATNITLTTVYIQDGVGL